MALAAAPLAAVPVTGEELGLTGAAGAASAAAVEEDAARAAAAIASGAFGLLAAGVVAVAGVSASATVTGIAVAIAFSVATGVPPCGGAVAGSAELVELLSADGLSVDLPPPEGVEADLAPVDCAALGLPLPPAAAALEWPGCAALAPALFEFEGGGGA